MLTRSHIILVGFTRMFADPVNVCMQQPQSLSLHKMAAHKTRVVTKMRNGLCPLNICRTAL